MDVLSFYVTASILALSFDVGLFFQAVLLWLCDRGRKIEKMKKKKRQRWERENRIPLLFSLKIHKDAGKAYS